MGKGEIARYEQFLLFPQCFQKACFQGASEGVIVWEWVKTVTDSDDLAEFYAAFNIVSVISMEKLIHVSTWFQ